MRAEAVSPNTKWSIGCDRAEVRPLGLAHMVTKTGNAGVLLAVFVLGCAVEDAAPRDVKHGSELVRLGVYDVVSEGVDDVLLDEAGREIGRVSAFGPRVEADLDGEGVILERAGTRLGLMCSSMAERVVLESPIELADWIDGAAIGAACRRALRVASLVSGIESAHAGGCEIDFVDGEQVLICDPSVEDPFRTLGSGCGCQVDSFGYCGADCWDCGGGFGYDSFGSFCEDPFGDPWGDPWDDGGGWEPDACTPYGNDCTVGMRCCGSNVCAYDGERDRPWCQPFESSDWDGRCVRARTGSEVRKNGSVCRHTNGMETDTACLDVSGQSCVIGYNGDCGHGEYTIHTRDLAQVPSENCPD